VKKLMKSAILSNILTGPKFDEWALDMKIKWIGVIVAVRITP
jgi:hypothetical protein